MEMGLPPSQPPVAQGLYDPRNEHDACGVGFIANVKGKKSNAVSHDLMLQTNLACSAPRPTDLSVAINTTNRQVAMTAASFCTAVDKDQSRPVRQKMVALQRTFHPQVPGIQL